MLKINFRENKDYISNSLYQWDLNRVLEIRGLSLPSVPEIHFTNGYMDRAIVKQAVMDTAGVITVEVPNSILQKPYNIKAHICIYEGDTFKSLFTLVIPVKERKKPGDYTLEDDEEIYSFNALENHVNNKILELTAKCEETIDSVTEGYDKAVVKINSKIEEIETKAIDEKIGLLDSLKTKVKTNLVNAINSLAAVAFSGDYKDLSNTPTIDSALSTSSTNAIQNKVVKTELNRRRTMHIGIEALGVATTSTKKLSEIFDLMDNVADTTFFVQSTRYPGVYNEILAGVKTAYPNLTSIGAHVTIRKNGSTCYVTVEDYTNSSNKFECVYKSGVPGTWVKNLTTNDTETRREYQNPSNFGCSSTDQKLKLIDLINAMEAKSHVNFWISRNNTDLSKSQYLGIYTEVLTGIKVIYPEITDAYGNVDIMKTDGTSYIKFSSYANPNWIFVVTHSTVNSKGWSGWEKIITTQDMTPLLSATDLNFDDVFTVPEGVTISESSIVIRGKHIYADIAFSGSITSDSSALAHILTIKSGYLPIRNFSQGVIINRNKENGQIFASATLYTSNGRSEIRVIFPSVSETYGNDSYPWSTSSWLKLDWEIE